MSEPINGKNKPFAVEVEASKTYKWCTCGRTAEEPFCDGAHKGSGMIPMKFEAAESKIVHLCGCKQSGNKPFCDGSHKNL